MQFPFRHEAVAYRGRDEFVSACVALVHDGLALEQRLILLAAEARLADVRDALGHDPNDITYVPTDEHGRNPSRIITLLDNFQSANGGRRCMGVTENVCTGRQAAELAEARLAESVLNHPALQRWPLTLTCLYEDDGSAAFDAHAMRKGHPAIRGEAGNADYEPELAQALFAEPLPPRPDDAETLVVGATRLADMREFVRHFGAQSVLAVDRVDDLVLAANEVVTNSVRHGGGRCQLAMWRDNRSVMCEVRDAGRITDPLVGRLAPSPAAAGGRGLWLVNHLCDLVQIRSSPAGTTVRLVIDR